MKENWSEQNFKSEKFCVRKKFWFKIFFGTNKISGLKILGPKNFVHGKNLGFKKISKKRIGGQNKFWDRKIFLKKIVGKKKIYLKKAFKKMLGLKKF